MSRPISPMQFSVYKITREYEKTGKTLFSKDELFDFARKSVKIASAIDNESYWILNDGDYDSDLANSISKICDETTNYFEVNEERMSNGGKRWAERVIGVMRYSFLKGALQVLNEELKEKENTKGNICD